MIVFGSIEAMRGNRCTESFTTVLNFNTLLENIPRLNYLNPYFMMTYSTNTNCYEFDMWYMNYIANEPKAFKEFIDFMRLAYNGYNVWVLVDFSTETATNVIETLIKCIVEQYGYICNVARVPEDTENFVEGQFSPMGIQMFDTQMENYIVYFGNRGLITDPE